jgi:ribonuclease HI
MPISIFADGASSGNPGPGGWGAIILDEAQQVRELAGGDAHTTNNRMELSAVHAALSLIRDQGLAGTPIEIYTDSTYVIRGITQWVHGWRRNGWKTAEGNPVLNRDLWEALSEECAALRGRDLRWNHVRGHSGIPANERVDELAVQMSKGLEPQLYSGPLASYGIDLHDLEIRHEQKKRPAPGKGPAYYLSLVGANVVRHSTWAECEARVKGVPGARYRKVTSSEEEREILDSWGVRRN